MPEAKDPDLERRADVLIVRPSARELDDAQMTTLRHMVLDGVADAPALPVVLDLAAVTQVPSVALGALIRLRTQLGADDHRLVLVHVQVPIRQLMVITRLDRVFEMASDMNAARSALGLAHQPGADRDA